jgi:two-component system NtrC family sensor kinase
MAADAGRNPYGRMRAQMFAVLLLFGLVPLVVMGAAGLAANRRASERQARKVLEAMVKNRAATVDLFLEETLREIDLIASSCSIDELSDARFLETVRDRMQREHGAIVDLGLIGSDGRHVAYVGPYNLMGNDYSHEPWFQQTLVEGSYQSDIFLGFRRFPHMVMAVLKRADDRTFILRATLDTDVLSALVREGALESGADVFILNRAGEYQTQPPDGRKLMETSDLGSLPPHSGVRVAEQRRNGGREFVATSWLRGDSWVLVARQKAPGLAVAAAEPPVLALFAAGLLLVPLASFFVARFRLRQFHRLEAERAALYESVAQSQKMAAIGRMAASVAHEINNPLAIIQSQAGVLADAMAEGQPPLEAGEVRSRLEKIQAQVERGRKVTHRLLGFSRRVGPELEPVDVAAALRETLSFVEKELEASKIRVVREEAEDTPLVRSSLSQMQQVFLNLINNALDAIDGEGTVTLEVRPQDGGVLVRIGDDGRGIPQRDLERVFEPFYTTKDRAGAHGGLGLAICRDIMNGLGGRIEVESAPGRGTVFTLWFPPEADRS